MDEEADLALLDQHLLKTNLLSQRMTNILGQLDTRLSRLDKTIAPLGLQPLTTKDANIEALLLALEGKRPSISTTSNNNNNSSSNSRPQVPTISTSVAPSASGPSSARSRTGGGGITSPTTPKGYSLDPFPLGAAFGSPSASSSSGQGNVPAPPAIRRIANDHNQQHQQHLSPIQSAAPSGTNSPADETALLTRGPDIMSLNEYFVALDGVVGDLERMWKGLMEGRGGAREAGVKDLSKLVEIGFQGMTHLFLKLSREGMGKTVDADSLLASGPPTPPNLFPPLNTLLPLSTKISTLLTSSSSTPANGSGPTSSPTPKTTSIIQPIWEDALQSFAELRGEWICRSLSGMLSRVEEIDEGGIWSGGRSREKVQGLSGLWESLLVFIEAETLLITTLFPNNPPPTLLTRTISNPLSLLSSTLDPMINTIKRSLSSHTFVALDLYSSLTRIQGRWDTSISKCLNMTNTPSSPATKEVLSVLNQPISTLRSLTLRSFPELLVDIRTAKTDGTSTANGHALTPTSSISEITHSTLGYLETLPEYEQIVENLLGKSHSERSWLMGMKEAPSPAKSANEEGGTVNLFVADVLGTLLIHLEGRARTMKKPIAQAFLLNNLSHIRNTTSSFNSDIIGPGAEDMLNKAFRDAKGQYLSEFHGLVNLLTTTHSTPRFGVPVSIPQGERHNLKESAQTFFDKLSELENVVTQYPLNRQDPDMRDRLAREVEGIVRGGYEAFWGRCAGKGIEKYLRGSPDDITRRVQAMFR
ncbi:hypothetical protein IAT40_007196 [Kwoniella sp. CBS 6097]